MTTPRSRVLFNPRTQQGNSTRTCSIAGVGSYVPGRILANAELERIVETSDDWITTRTGIKERRLAADREYTSDLAAEAARRAMIDARITAEEIDLIIVATITPDTPFPSTACWVQQKLGARRAAAFDIEAACSGFLYAMEIGQQFVMTQTFNTVLVIGAEKLSSIVDWKDRNTCVLFGDGAGAVVLQNRPGSHGLLTVCLGADGSKTDLLGMPGGGSRQPATRETVEARLHFLKMDGKETYKNAVTAMGQAAKDALRRCQLDVEQIACIIPHQANRRIIDAVADRIGAKPGQVFVNLEKYGNTSAASVAIALDEAAKTGRIKQGDLVLMVAFGAGFTWAAAVIEW
jgi:3-oxoacyl-[acyl-carrier-protein] synthase-3